MTGCENLHQVAERQGVRSAALDWYGARSHARGPLASIVDGTPGHDSFPTTRRARKRSPACWRSRPRRGRA